MSLNPYSIGICSRRVLESYQEAMGTLVLILILMEYALGGDWEWKKEETLPCLNPYSNGICSRSS